jgi:hypothetical protein
VPTSKYREMVGKEMLTIVVSRVAIKIDKQTTKRMSGNEFSWVGLSIIMAIIIDHSEHICLMMCKLWPVHIKINKKMTKQPV